MCQPLQHLKYDLTQIFCSLLFSGNQKARVGWEPSFGATSTKPKLNGSLPPQTPTRTSIMGLPRTPAYRRKTLQDAKLSEGIYSVHFNNS